MIIIIIIMIIMILIVMIMIMIMMMITIIITIMIKSLEELYREAAGGFRKQLGVQDPATLASINNLAVPPSEQ